MSSRTEAKTWKETRQTPTRRRPTRSRMTAPSKARSLHGPREREQGDKEKTHALQEGRRSTIIDGTTDDWILKKQRRRRRRPMSSQTATPRRRIKG